MAECAVSMKKAGLVARVGPWLEPGVVMYSSRYPLISENVARPGLRTRQRAG